MNSSTSEDSPGARPIFYYDLASPECWLAGERVHHVLGEVPVWQPVLLPGRRALPAPDDGRRAELERLAAGQGLPAVVWPPPFDPELAMRAAAFAQGAGRVVAFSLAALRQAFAAGRDLSVAENVLVAAAACELHPRAVLTGVESRGVRRRLEEASNAALAVGVAELPAVAMGAEVFEGARAPEDAAEASTGAPSHDVIQ